MKKIESLEYHEGFGISYLENDVGVMILEEEIIFNEKVQSIELPSKNITTDNISATLSGWGRLEVNFIYFYTKKIKF